MQFIFSGFLKNHCMNAFLLNYLKYVALLECWMALWSPYCGTDQSIWQSLSVDCLFSSFRWNCPRYDGIAPSADCLTGSFWWNCPRDEGTAPSLDCFFEFPFCGTFQNVWHCSQCRLPFWVPFLWNCSGKEWRLYQSKFELQNLPDASNIS